MAMWVILLTGLAVMGYLDEDIVPDWQVDFCGAAPGAISKYLLGKWTTWGLAETPLLRSGSPGRASPAQVHPSRRGPPKVLWEKKLTFQFSFQIRTSKDL